MEPAKIRSAGVTAAAALAIMGSSFGLIIWGFFILPMTNYQDRAGRHLYQIAPLFFGVVALVPPLLIAMGIQTGIGLFQLQRWARKAALIWAAIALFFCLSMIASRPFETFFFPERFVSDLVAFKQILALSFVIMLLPFSIWWLFFFRLASVKAQFEPPNAVPPGDKLHLSAKIYARDGGRYHFLPLPLSGRLSITRLGDAFRWTKYWRSFQNSSQRWREGSGGEQFRNHIRCSVTRLVRRQKA